MRIVTADDIHRVLSYSALIDAIADAFRADIEVPLRHTHMIPQPNGPDAKLLLMPAWTNDGERLVGCKVVSVYPGNLALGKPSVTGSYLLLSGETGETLAVVEAMKMENVLRAARDGTIKVLHAKAGDSLRVDQKILEFA